MKKKITIVSIVALVCALTMVLSGCWFFVAPFDKLVTSLKKNGRYDEANGTYTVSEYDIEYDSTSRIIYNESEADKVTLVYEANGDVTKVFITKEQSNYKWEHNDSDYGLFTGNINIEYRTNEPEFFEFDAFDIGVEDFELVDQVKQLMRYAIEICILDLELYLEDNTFNTDVTDFGIHLIIEDV